MALSRPDSEIMPYLILREPVINEICYQTLSKQKNGLDLNLSTEAGLPQMEELQIILPEGERLVVAEGRTCASCHVYLTIDVFDCMEDEHCQDICIWCRGGRGHRCTSCEKLYVGDSSNVFDYYEDGKRAETCILCKARLMHTEDEMGYGPSATAGVPELNIIFGTNHTTKKTIDGPNIHRDSLKEEDLTAIHVGTASGPLLVSKDGSNADTAWDVVMKQLFKDARFVRVYVEAGRENRYRTLITKWVD